MQTWSKMAVISVRRSGIAATGANEANTDRVLVFGGGYDATKLDDQLTRLTSGGGAIYMVDKNGQLIWKNEDQMNYAMPADLAVVDSDDDGLADLMYAADLGGQIWRVDFDDVNSASDFSVKKFASLGDNSYQPFFYPPSITLAGSHNNEHFTVSIGSGNRDHPLDSSSNNRLYMLKDFNTDRHSIDPNTPTIVESNLYDATNYNLGSSNSATLSQEENKLKNAAGWMLKLKTGENHYLKLLILNGMYLATTYSPAQKQYQYR